MVNRKSADITPNEVISTNRRYFTRKLFCERKFISLYSGAEYIISEYGTFDSVRKIDSRNSRSRYSGEYKYANLIPLNLHGMNSLFQIFKENRFVKQVEEFQCQFIDLSIEII